MFLIKKADFASLKSLFADQGWLARRVNTVLYEPKGGNPKSPECQKALCITGFRRLSTLNKEAI